LALVGILIIVLVTNSLINLVVSINNAQLQKQVTQQQTQQQSDGTDLIKKDTTYNEKIRLSCDCSDPVVVTITKIVAEPAHNRMVWSLTFYNNTLDRSDVLLEQFSLGKEDQLGGQTYVPTGAMLVGGRIVDDVILQANETKQATLTFSFVPYKAIPYTLESQLDVSGGTHNFIQFNPIVIKF
jgi:type II secretory pathway pseudopilin PulG